MRDEIALGLSVILVALCAAGIICKHFRENWLQLAGMGFVLMAACMTGWHAWATQRTSSRVTLLLLGVTLFAIGTAWKVWQHHRRPASDNSGGSAPYKLEPAEQHQVAGGGAPLEPLR